MGDEEEKREKELETRAAREVHLLCGNMALSRKAHGQFCHIYGLLKAINCTGSTYMAATYETSVQIGQKYFLKAVKFCPDNGGRDPASGCAALKR
ncbi:hypothetical protein EVAR_63226_1 [Eumeta japonica]|uniref:Uncharacterized protein n=1 Tax=Eumeta variegata TaxID=151549 RepID=A0A4C1ZIF1_EUMVA|nr:hypothetical protein EVAR_63226_1 [Eumeta japonica]